MGDDSVQRSIGKELVRLTKRKRINSFLNGILKCPWEGRQLAEKIEMINSLRDRKKDGQGKL